MKLLHYILAIYTVLLSCIPCQDEMIVVSDHTHIAAEKADSGNKSADLCSPFCICACCSGILLHQSAASLPEISSVTFPEESIFSYTRRTDSGDLTSIWQPPRI